MKRNRKKKFSRNEALDNLLERLNTLLEPVEEDVIRQFDAPRYPVIFIVGCPRSGSTLLLQFCAASGRFAYPSNFLSRFYAAPHVGSLIQQMLLCDDYQFRDEFADVAGTKDFVSELGKTRGMLSPNEFWFLWRRFFPCPAFQYPDMRSVPAPSMERFVAQLAAIESVFAMPLVLKAHIMNCHIPRLSRAFPMALFINIIRKPVYNAQSLLEARLSYYGTPDAWYSFKPLEYEEIKKADPCTQVAGQVFYTERTVREGMRRLPSERKLNVSYEDFCRNPHEVFASIQHKCALQGCRFSGQYAGPERFPNRNRRRVTAARFNRIQKAYEQFTKGILPQ